MSSVFDGYEAYKGDIPLRSYGSLVAFETGEALTYGLFYAQDRGEMFVVPGDQVYAGMIVGANTRPGRHRAERVQGQTPDLHPQLRRRRGRPCCLKCRAAHDAGTGPEFISDDELVEITPHFIRMAQAHPGLHPAHARQPQVLLNKQGTRPDRPLRAPAAFSCPPPKNLAHAVPAALPPGRPASTQGNAAPSRPPFFPSHGFPARGAPRLHDCSRAAFPCAAPLLRKGAPRLSLAAFPRSTRLPRKETLGLHDRPFFPPHGFLAMERCGGTSFPAPRGFIARERCGVIPALASLGFPRKGAPRLACLSPGATGPAAL